MNTKHDFAYKAGVVLASAFCALVLTLLCWFGYFTVVKLLAYFALSKIFFGIWIFWMFVCIWTLGKEEDNG